MGSQWRRVFAGALVLVAINGFAFPKEITFLSSGDRPISQLSFSNRGDKVACVSVISEVAVWDLKQKRRLVRFDASAKGCATTVEFSPSGESIRVLALKGRRLDNFFDGWELCEGNVNTGELTLHTSSAARERAVAYWPETSTVVAIFEDANNLATPYGLRLINVDTKESRISLFAEPIGIPTSFSPNKKFVILKGTKGKVTIAEIATGKSVGSFPVHEGGCESMMMSRDNKTLITVPRNFKGLDFFGLPQTFCDTTPEVQALD